MNNEDILKQITDKIKQLKLYEKDRIDEIIVCSVPNVKNDEKHGFRIEYKGKWYLLASRLFVENLKRNFQQIHNPYDSFFIGSVNGIPIREDEELGWIIYMSASTTFILNKQEKHGIHT